MDVRITGDEFDHKLIDYVVKDKKIKDETKELNKLKSFIKEKTTDKYYQIYKETGKNPGTLNILSDSDASIQLIPSDKYYKLDDERVKELKDKYGESIIKENTKYIFNSEMVNKYAKVLTKMIMESDDISDEDKLKIIDVEVDYEIKKGSINNPPIKESVENYIDDIKPIFSNKNPKLK